MKWLKGKLMDTKLKSFLSLNNTCNSCEYFEHTRGMGKCIRHNILVAIEHSCKNYKELTDESEYADLYYEE